MFGRPPLTLFGESILFNEIFFSTFFIINFNLQNISPTFIYFIVCTNKKAKRLYLYPSAIRKLKSNSIWCLPSNEQCVGIYSEGASLSLIIMHLIFTIYLFNFCTVIWFIKIFRATLTFTLTFNNPNFSLFWNKKYNLSST